MITIPKIDLVKSHKDTHSLVLAFENAKELKHLGLKKEELDYVQECLSHQEKLIVLNQYHRLLFLLKIDKSSSNENQESLRKQGAAVLAISNKQKIEHLALQFSKYTSLLYAFAEGLLLANYQFLRYKSYKKINSLKSLFLLQDEMSKDELKKLSVIVKSTLSARELVNEPNSYLTSTVFAKHIKSLCEEAGCEVQVFDKGKIEKLQMGGLLAVNKGSIEPPTFTVIEYKPKKAKNDKPIVLVGKGVVYDTGGLSLKPTAHSMDYMKSDMAGAAAVAGAMHAIASLKADVHVIGLIPSTDNRPGGNAYAPGDVVKMMNGLNVEVLNTDAEGRMILADALTYADRFEPELVLNTATLTGAAARAIGTYGIVAMGNAGEKPMKKIKETGEKVFERLVEFPFWSEYDDEIKSDIADLKNLGSDLGGAITAGKFLAHFTKAPFIHLDIAGPSYLHRASDYRTIGGTGVGVRLFTEFVLNY